MADIMRVVPFEELLERITGELRNHGSIFNIKKEMFFSDDEKKAAWMKREEEKYEEMIFHQLADDFYDEDFPLEDDELPF